MNWAKLLAFVGSVIVIVWAFLKSIEILHSPIWMDMIPYFGVGITLLGCVFWLGKLSEKVDCIPEIKTSIIEISKEIHEIDKKVDILETRIKEYSITPDKPENVADPVGGKRGKKK
ncbi:MAG: hypothetical protein KAW41_06310 [Candidatus Diapherotrites archaeon]|nr:hypothetical protein [Candidatus Diapherotrites archaeon]